MLFGWTIVTVCLPVFRLDRLLVCSLFCVQLPGLFFNYLATLLCRLPSEIRCTGLASCSVPPTSCDLYTTYKCLHGLAPIYLSRYCVPLASVPGRCLLRSADANKLSTPRTLTSTLGPQSFSVSGPTSWNALPPLQASRH